MLHLFEGQGHRPGHELVEVGEVEQRITTPMSREETLLGLLTAYGGALRRIARTYAEAQKAPKPSLRLPALDVSRPGP